jgi:maltooligosyltrehalose trehalohydrolase
MGSGSPVLARRLPVGAELLRDGAHFRVWAPDHRDVSLAIDASDASPGYELRMTAEPDGYFSASVEHARVGLRYRYRLGSSPDLVPDPASRFQPDGPHGSSELIDPAAFEWTDGGWHGVTPAGQVLYEMHVGTFTAPGTWEAAMSELPALADLGITVIEVMPIAEFAGRFGWSYDGVDLFAPSHLYGRPDDFRRFVDRAHALGLGVILDVVYNHLGPSGNYLGRFTRRYFSSRWNEWGEAVNFDNDAGPVRELVIANAGYWIDEFHLDGLRLDATQQIYDNSPENVMAEVASRVRRAANERHTVVTAENEPQLARLVRPREHGGYGLDAMWNDDFHHAAMVALTGRRDAYYTDYKGDAQELVSLAKWGFLFQGQRYSWQKSRRGTPTFGLRPHQMVTFLQNHDQIANAPSCRGERIHQIANAGAYRAMTAYWLLSPGTPMFFQGQEFAASTPFLYFADHEGELGRAVRTGRAEFMSQFRSPATRHLFDALPDPGDADTFVRCKLRADERRGEHPVNRQALRLHRDLLSLRREDRAFGVACVDGAVLAPGVCVLRFFERDPHAPVPRNEREDRLLVVNLAVDLRLDPAPEPLLAPPLGYVWDIRWSSEDPAYGGMGTAPLDTEENWRIPGGAAVVLRPVAS